MDKQASLTALHKQMANCQNCALGATRTNLVFGKGNPAAGILFIGEGPGAEEDQQGLPFVGRAGRLLDQLIAESGLPTEEIYIANVVKCRPPGNRLPLPEETEACKVYLREQLKIIAPKIIICLGAHATQLVIDPKAKITQMRGRFVQKGRFIIMPTFHPAALLRDPAKKIPVHQDLQAVYQAYLQITGRNNLKKDQSWPPKEDI